MVAIFEHFNFTVRCTHCECSLFQRISIAELSNVAHKMLGDRMCMRTLNYTLSLAVSKRIPLYTHSPVMCICVSVCVLFRQFWQMNSILLNTRWICDSQQVNRTFFNRKLTLKMDTYPSGLDCIIEFFHSIYHTLFFHWFSYYTYWGTKKIWRVLSLKVLFIFNYFMIFFLNFLRKKFHNFLSFFSSFFSAWKNVYLFEINIFNIKKGKISK